MSGIVRFVFNVEEQDGAWSISLTSDKLPQAVARRMERHSVGNRDFPLPPADDRPAAGEIHAGLCTPEGLAELADIQSRIGTRSPAGQDIERYGRYLFSCLIGESWNEITAAAGDVALIELALSFDEHSEGHPLQRMNWEMMRGPDGYLSSGLPRRVVVSRLVKGTAAPRQTAAPPRVLFIVGAALSDKRLRPGAEILGLLRNIQRGGKSIHSRILQSASPRSIAAALDDFEPDIVHLICHGNVNKDGTPFLELQSDEDDQVHRPTAEQLLLILDRGAGLPAMVVLSACYSAASKGHAGEPMNPQDTAPLAAQLVRGGVPVVVGMTGRVADLACRLFVRRFGEALVEGEHLLVAAEQGRRVAFSEGESPDTTMDWAYPALFLSEQVKEDFRPIDTAADAGVAAFESQVVRKLGLEKQGQPVFCGRDDIFEAFYELFRDGSAHPGAGNALDSPSVLLIFDEKNSELQTKIGRTRLLQMLAIQALRDGHIPIVVSGPKPGWLAPKNIDELTRQLLDAVDATREAMSLPRDLHGSLLKLLKAKNYSELAQDPGISQDLVYELTRMEGEELPLGAVRAALCADLENLRNAVAVKYPRFAKARTVVLLDDVHDYDKLLQPLFDELRATGLAAGDKEDYREIVPVVLILALNSPTGQVVRKLLEVPPTWLAKRELTEFREGEDRLAYERVLLSPYQKDLVPDYSDRSWVVSRSATEQEIDNHWVDGLRKLRKLPSVFSDGSLYWVVYAGEKLQVVVEATDEDLLDKMRAEQ